MKYIFSLVYLTVIVTIASAQTPEVTSWILNNDGKTGYGGIASNIQQVQYSDDNVYISATCIPGYDIGPWPGNPNTPKNQNFVYKITRHPAVNSGTAVGTPLGHIGVWSNGVSMFNAKDAMSYKNAGIWNQNAIIVEGASFDNCLGHPAPNGEYHHHLNPTCLYDDKDSSKHSPIIGFAFDGNPVYGAYGFANADGSGKVTRMRSSYRMRNISDRSTLADGTILTATQYGPAISAQYPLGYYVEDFEYNSSFGDLDEHNGRFSVTPEYPGGTYAYFVTLDATGTAEYPYTLGLTYYGVVPSGNTGPGSGHNTITETVKTYGSNGISEDTSPLQFSIFTNPATTIVSVYLDPSQHNNSTVMIADLSGRILLTKQNLQPAVPYDFDLSNYSNGTYTITITDGATTSSKQIVISK